jgi:hypothetical protein
MGSKKKDKKIAQRVLKAISDVKAAYSDRYPPELLAIASDASLWALHLTFALTVQFGLPFFPRERTRQFAKNVLRTDEVAFEEEEIRLRSAM